MLNLIPYSVLFNDVFKKLSIYDIINVLYICPKLSKEYLKIKEYSTIYKELVIELMLICMSDHNIDHVIESNNTKYKQEKNKRINTFLDSILTNNLIIPLAQHLSQNPQFKKKLSGLGPESSKQVIYEIFHIFSNFSIYGYSVFLKVDSDFTKNFYDSLNKFRKDTFIDCVMKFDMGKIMRHLHYIEGLENLLFSQYVAKLLVICNYK